MSVTPAKAGVISVNICNVAGYVFNDSKGG